MMAENFCSAPFPHPLSEHYYAKALNQYYDSLERLSPYNDGGLEEEIIFIFGFNAENFMKIRQGMTSGECVENKWFNMKYIGKYISVEIL
jgi:hypothetical protein